MTALLTAEVRVLLAEAHTRVGELCAERVALDEELTDMVRAVSFDEQAAVEVQTRSAVLTFDIEVWRRRLSYLAGCESAAVDGVGLVEVGE